MSENNKPKLAIISGPSGSGKGTVIDTLPFGYRKSVSATTRGIRAGEREGIDYFYMSFERFGRMIDNGELIEYNYYVGNLYGTPKAQIEDGAKQGLTTLFDVDVNGAEHIKEIYPDAPCVYILLPSAKEQVERLEGRGTESADTIKTRLAQTKYELTRINEFDLVLINEYGKLEKTASDLDDFLNGRRAADEITDRAEVEKIVAHYFD